MPRYAKDCSSYVSPKGLPGTAMPETSLSLCPDQGVVCPFCLGGLVVCCPEVLPPPLQSPPHPGDRHFHVFLVNMYCAFLCCPSALHMALHCFPITSNQATVCVL